MGHTIMKKQLIYLELLIAFCFLACSLIACNSKTSTSENDTKIQTQVQLGAPGVGAIQTVYIETKGQGDSRDLAIQDAINLAILQTNGQAGNGKGDVKDFKIIKEEEVTRSSLIQNGAVESVAGRSTIGIRNEQIEQTTSATKSTLILSGKERVWQVTLGLNILKYEGGSETQKTRIVIAKTKFNPNTININDNSDVPVSIVQQIQSILVSNITDTRRFFVIDRTVDEDLNSESSQINAQNGNSSELKKIGQRLNADLILIPNLEFYEIKKRVQKFNLSQREIISYSGRLKINMQVLNVVTGQVVMTDSYEWNLPESQNVSPQDLLKQNLTKIGSQFTNTLMQRTFPITIVSLNGNTAVLSQGGNSVKNGSIYQVVKLGEQIIDPQTKESLGRVESIFSTIKITNVSDKLSYGELIDPKPLSSEGFKSGLLEIRNEVFLTAQIESKGIQTETTSPKSQAHSKNKTDSSNDDFMNDKDFLKK